MSDLHESTARHQASGEAPCDATIAFAEAAASYGRHAAPVDDRPAGVIRLLPPLAPEPADETDGPDGFDEFDGADTAEKPGGGLWARLRGLGRAA